MAGERRDIMEKYDRLVEDQRRLLALYKMLGAEGSSTPFPAATGKIADLMQDSATLRSLRDLVDPCDGCEGHGGDCGEHWDACMVATIKRAVGALDRCAVAGE